MAKTQKMNRPKIILITHQKGGVGKSTLVANLALNLAKNALVAIVDLDHQGSLISLQGQFENIQIYPATTMISDLKDINANFILLDSPPYLLENTVELVKISDVIIVPTKASLLDIIAISRTLDILISSTTERNKILITLNMIKANTTLTNTVFRELKKHNLDIAKTRISDLVDFTRSISNKGLITKKAQYQIDALTKEILIKLI